MKNIKISHLFIALFLISSTATSYSLYSDTLQARKGLQGCCSHHGGVAGCNSGRVVCKDGTLSPTCTCNREAL